MRQFITFIIAIIVISCKNEPETKTLRAEDIINNAIEVSGGKKFNNSIIRFDFRDRYYKARRDKGQFSFIRIFVQGKDSIFDLLNNTSFERTINKNKVILSDSLVKSYSASVNSVHYFSVLPYGLNDKAVNKTLIGEEKIQGLDYYKIEVTFNEEGGGEDFDDVFVYWVNKNTFKPDYLAYSYNENDGKGMRFRKAYNERYRNGIRIVDYDNYKPKDTTIMLRELGVAFEGNQLQLVSKIELKNVSVDLINLQ